MDCQAMVGERSGRVLETESHWRHCVVSLSKNINPSLEVVQPRKTGPFITERLMMGHKESNQTNQEMVEAFNSLEGLPDRLQVVMEIKSRTQHLVQPSISEVTKPRYILGMCLPISQG